MAAFTPQAFGKYFLVDKIATGGMAEIFTAKTYSHGGFEHLLVIKRILAHLGDNEDFVEMFIDEAKVSVALQHANIIRIYDFGKILDNYFIAMEWLDGKDARNVLKKLAKQRRFLPFEFAAYIAHEACKGLDYAHRKTDLHGRPYGIVHRDVSPSNVLVSYEGDVKVADFGIAKAESNAYNTKDGVLKGKFEYMSPEQAHGLEIDHRSDIFSLGIILYEMLTGRRLFKTGSETATLEKIKTAEIPPPSTLHSRVPAELDAIAMKALTRDREQRYQSAREMQDDLLGFLLPATPDQIKPSLARFMAEVFADDIAQERERLARGSEIAEELRKNAPGPEGWDGQTNATLTRTSPGTTGVLAGAAVLALGLVGLLGVGGVGAAIWYSNQTPAEVVEAHVGSLDVLVMPAARILLDGEVVGEGDGVSLADLPPGEHTVRLEADGYEPLEVSVSIVAGEGARIRRTLTPLAPEVEDEPVAVAAPTGGTEAPVGPPRVRFESTPPGAMVLVDNRIVGRTPFTWSEGAAGASYQVELRLDGHRSASGSLSELARGQTTTFRQALEPLAAAPGRLNVALIGGGWANVYVDGRKLDRTAPLSNYELPPGTYTIRVENEAAGIDHAEQVQVTSGGAVRVSARPQ